MSLPTQTQVNDLLLKKIQGAPWTNPGSSAAAEAPGSSQIRLQQASIMNQPIPATAPTGFVSTTTLASGGTRQVSASYTYMVYYSNVTLSSVAVSATTASFRYAGTDATSGTTIANTNILVGAVPSNQDPAGSYQVHVYNGSTEVFSNGATPWYFDGTSGYLTFYTAISFTPTITFWRYEGTYGTKTTEFANPLNNCMVADYRNSNTGGAGTGYGIYVQSSTISGRGNTLDYYATDQNSGTAVTRSIMSILPTGNVGINNIAPSVSLDVSGDVRVTGTIETNTLKNRNNTGTATGFITNTTTMAYNSVDAAVGVNDYVAYGTPNFTLTGDTGIQVNSIDTANKLVTFTGALTVPPTYDLSKNGYITATNKIQLMDTTGVVSGQGVKMTGITINNSYVSSVDASKNIILPSNSATLPSSTSIYGYVDASNNIVFAQDVSSGYYYTGGTLPTSGINYTTSNITGRYLSVTNNLSQTIPASTSYQLAVGQVYSSSEIVCSLFPSGTAPVGFFIDGNPSNIPKGSRIASLGSSVGYMTVTNRTLVPPSPSATIDGYINGTTLTLDNLTGLAIYQIIRGNGIASPSTAGNRVSSINSTNCTVTMGGSGTAATSTTVTAYIRVPGQLIVSPSTTVTAGKFLSGTGITGRSRILSQSGGLVTTNYTAGMTATTGTALGGSIISSTQFYVTSGTPVVGRFVDISFGTTITAFDASKNLVTYTPSIGQITGSITKSGYIPTTTTLIVSDATGLSVGMAVQGPGITDTKPTITAISGTTCTLGSTTMTVTGNVSSQSQYTFYTTSTINMYSGVTYTLWDAASYQFLSTQSIYFYSDLSNNYSQYTPQQVNLYTPQTVQFFRVNHITVPQTSDTVVVQDYSQTLTNKTLTSPTITNPTIVGGTLNGQTTDIVLDISNNSIKATNSAGVKESFLWPRWSGDNGTYMNYGSGGMYFRNSSSATTLQMYANNFITGSQVFTGVINDCLTSPIASGNSAGTASYYYLPYSSTQRVLIQMYHAYDTASTTWSFPIAYDSGTTPWVFCQRWMNGNQGALGIQSLTNTGFYCDTVLAYTDKSDFHYIAIGLKT